MTLPLEGYRILELTMWGAAPFGVRQLADMGAEVIKIEEPIGGDRMRGANVIGGGNARSGIAVPHKINYGNEVANRGKKSIALDVRTPEGRDTIYKMIPKTDVFVSSLRQKSLKKFGLDYATLSKINPKLIFAHLGTFGPKGPDADLPGQDTTGTARAGLMNLLRHNPKDRFLAEGPYSMGDTAGSMQLCYGVTLALLARERTGIGQEVDVSILGALIEAQGWLFQIYLTTGHEPHLREHHEILNPIRNSYQCGDGKALSLGMTEGDRYWKSFCTAIERQDLADDPKFAKIGARADNSRELTRILDQVFMTKSRDEWCAILKKHDCTAAPVQTYSEVAKDPQVLANKYVINVDHPEHGPLTEVGFTVSLSKTPARVQAPGPELGQHTEEVLTEVAGLSWDDLIALKDKKVII